MTKKDNHETEGRPEERKEAPTRRAEIDVDDRQRTKILTKSFDMLQLLTTSDPRSAFVKAMLRRRSQMSSDASQPLTIPAQSAFPFPCPRVSPNLPTQSPPFVPFRQNQQRLLEGTLGVPTSPTTTTAPFPSFGNIKVAFEFARPQDAQGSIISLIAANGWPGFGPPAPPLGMIGPYSSNDAQGVFLHYLPLPALPLGAIQQGQSIKVKVTMAVGDPSEPNPDNNFILRPIYSDDGSVLAIGTANLGLRALGMNTAPVTLQIADWIQFLYVDQVGPNNFNLWSWQKTFDLCGSIFLSANDAYSLETTVTVSVYALRNQPGVADPFGFAGVNFGDRSNRLAPFVWPTGIQPDIDRSIRVTRIEFARDPVRPGTTV